MRNHKSQKLVGNLGFLLIADAKALAPDSFLLTSFKNRFVFCANTVRSFTKPALKDWCETLDYSEAACDVAPRSELRSEGSLRLENFGSKGILLAGSDQGAPVRLQGWPPH